MKLTYRKDYRAPDYKISATELDFTLNPEATIVKSKLHLQKINDAPLVLNGREDVTLLSVRVDGKEYQDYQLSDNTLTITGLADSCTLEITTQIAPAKNTRLMGLYMSNGIYCTQCEPEGFRGITFFLDHPDVMSVYTVTIHAERAKYPVLLSNGNKIKDEGDTVVWHDPFAKPSYLFALVAGDLGHIEDTFQTCSGRKVDLRIYCEKGKEGRLLYAMDSLKRAMKWDEDKFGREYDLDLFNIVAVSDFNAGAMENKSLNIFNDSCLLADQDTVTDATYEFVEGVVAHEYFHNWSGDRVTARDWFNLSLKEGFTVYRDETFTSDMRSKVVKRIDDVNALKLYQFPSDDGPLKHPVRPESFATIENFYTTTVYEKGAELIRMQEKLVGWNGFRKGTDLYFSRHDGQAVTIDDFVKCIEDANHIDLKPFMNWYSVAGRPEVKVNTHYDAANQRYTLTLSQSIKGSDAVFMMPIDIGLVDENGNDMVAETLVFDKKEQTFVFENIASRPVLSFNRHFTAPITVDMDYSKQDALHLISHDSDLFNRYEIGQEFALQEILQALENPTLQSETIETLARAFSSYLDTANTDPAFTARAVIFPAASYIGNKMKVFDVDAVLDLRTRLRQEFARLNKDKLFNIYQELNKDSLFDTSPKSAGLRALKNTALGYLSLLDEYKNLAAEQYFSSTNMTDRMAALSALVHNHLPEEQKALDDFYHRYQNDALVINKWLALQASVEEVETLAKVKDLASQKDFVITNPNKVRSLIGVFARNLKAFHQTSGEGYSFVADYVIKLNALNPQVAETLVHPLCQWRRFDETRQVMMKQNLNRILATHKLSVNLAETITKALQE